MHRLPLLVFFAIALQAQNPADLFNKAPAGVDEALRARINEFYQFHVKQQFRQAEELVAKDTKEFFYTHNKPQYLSFEISRIEYSKDFTKAKATMVTEQYIMMPGFANKPMKIPSPSTWKLEDGKWYWYVDQDELRQSPFGKMTPGPGGPGPGLPAVLPDSPDFIMRKVKAEKNAVTVKTGESVEIKIHNSADGYMNLRLLQTLPGIDAALDNSQVKPNGDAILKIMVSEGAKSGDVGVRIDQTLEVLNIAVTVVPGPARPAAAEAAAAPVRHPVKADRDAVTVKRGEAAQIRFTNPSGANATLKVIKPLAGITASFDHMQLKAGGEAVLKIVAGKAAKSGTLGVRADTAADVVSIAVTVK